MAVPLPELAALSLDASAREAACFHCAEPLPSTPIHAGEGAARRDYCCTGCAAAAQWIADARLGDYYRFRSQPAARVGEARADFSAWDHADVQDAHARDVEGGREIVLLTDGMRCAACAWLIHRALAKVPGVQDASANAVTGRVRLQWDPRATRLSAVLGVLATLGFRPFLAAGSEREDARRRARNRDLLRLGIAALGAMQAMMFAEALYFDFRGEMALPTRDFFRWVTFLVSTPVVFYAGWPFLAGAARELRELLPGMDTLIATSLLLAWIASVVETVRGGPHVWYDAAVMFVFLLLGARLLEQRARNIGNAQVDALARAQPALATREGDDGSIEVVPVARLAAGDIVRIGAGETVPADGTLLDAPAAFVESFLTGESEPVLRETGAAVYAGTTSTDCAARIRLTQVGSDTRLSELVRLVERAQAHRPRSVQLADRVALVFVPAMLVATACVYLAWRWHEPARAVEVALALLVISCPCALSLSVPAALAASHATLARLGVLATSGDALDRLARATDVVFDKTGTLGERRMDLERVTVLGDVDPDTAIGIAASLARASAHPVSAALQSSPGVARAVDVRETAGSGLEGTLDGRRWRLGSAAFAAGAVDDGEVWLGDGTQAIARFKLREFERADAGEAIAALRALGLDVHLASGDAEDRVTRLASILGIDAVAATSRQSPEDKLAGVRSLQSRGRVVLMVGDGLNDAPVLAGADVSFAIADGSALAQRAASLVATGASLARIPAAVALARRTRAVIRQNLAWAIAYNVVALPLAAAGMVTPWIAALGMAGSSLAVTLNALRLARARP